MRSCFTFGLLPVRLLTAVAAFWVAAAQAAPQLVSVVPARGATGVPVNTTVVFTFNEPMDPDMTSATFFTTGFPLGTTETWSQNDTVLTCAPNASFPANTSVNWLVSGVSQQGEDLEEEFAFPGFTTAGGGGNNNSGSGTNRITSFLSGVVHFYNQTNSTAPVLDDVLGYTFQSMVTLASNRTANTITVTPPGSLAKGLAPISGKPEMFSFFDSSQNLAYIDTTYPQGNYTFHVSATTSNQQVTVNLPGPTQQPNTPVIANYSALQNIDPSQNLTLTWNSFQNGNDPSAWIFVSFDSITNSPEFYEPGALRGTATSYTIPAALLKPNTNYSVMVGFYRANATTNATEYRGAYRASLTMFDVYARGTNGTPGGSLSFGGIVRTANGVGVDINTTAGQTITIETNSAVRATGWGKLYTTNAPASKIRFLVNPTPQGNLFYRARNGS